MNLTELSLIEAANLLKGREISAEELTRSYLERIQAQNPIINAFITITADLALKQAQEADQALGTGAVLGPLHGVPIALKDLFETRQIRTTAGSRILSEYIPSRDCTVYQKLRASGAVLLGKLNMHEWAFGVTNQNPHYGPVLNPWDNSRISGGSSGGSAAALASGLCLGALGTDTGGSIRIPASLCGVVGLKPTYGMVSMEGVIPLSRSLDHVGPMGRRVEDVAVLYEVIADLKPEMNQPIGDTEFRRITDTQNLESQIRAEYSIALASDPYFQEADALVLDAVRAAASAFEALGARVDPYPIAGASEALSANVTLLLAEAAAYHAPNVRSRPQDYSEDVLERLQIGAALTHDQIAEARGAQKAIRARDIRIFDRYDLLLTPTTPSVAYPIEQTDPLQAAPKYTRFTAPFNLTGLPAVSLPCGFTPEALPIGLQLVGPPGSEQQLLRAAYAYEQSAGWLHRHPDERQAGVGYQ